MRFDVVTLFPDLFTPHLTLGVTRRAYESRQVDVHLWPLRDYADDNYRRVDDRPFGGGPGMVLAAPPVVQRLTEDAAMGLAELEAALNRPIRLQAEAAYHPESFDVVPLSSINGP